jgi:glutamate racemase
VTVGVFDSGVGGLSVLPALERFLPQARLIYLADSGHAPYGERDDAWLQHRCLQIAAFMQSRGAQMLVVACNTATAAAADALRQRYPDWPIVGMEPGIKPAVARSKSGRVGVMATEATLRSRRYARLLAEHGQGAMVVAEACTGLAKAIERGDEPSIAELVDRHTRPMRDAQVDTLVLGCTHYPWARPWIEAVMGPGVELIDTADAVAHRAATLALTLSGTSLPKGSREFWSSARPSDLENFAARWLKRAVKAKKLLTE